MIVSPLPSSGRKQTRENNKEELKGRGTHKRKKWEGKKREKTK
jgi:hypothetical protein